MGTQKPLHEHSSQAEDLPRIVGIGASAGGLEALRELMESLPTCDTACYVIAQHVSPTHVSTLGNLLAPLTHLGVQDLTDGQRPVGGRVFITPPNRNVTLEHGLLRLAEPPPAIGPKPSVSRLFHSLADEQGEKAIGIILSGTGSDGTSGIREIKGAGGITIAQEPDTAKYDGMPKSAIQTGSIDLILSPAEIGPAIARLLRQPADHPILVEDDGDPDEYARISALVRRNTAFRLNEYKSGTVRRRIARRMNILGVTTLAEYIGHLQQHQEESVQLMRDTFIGVTSFFRDRDAYFALEQVIGQIVDQHHDGEVIRCWVPACASGEEVYSIAMLFEESLHRHEKSGVQYIIFASDLDDCAIERARSALYSISELEGVPRALRERYTEVVGDHCRIVKSIRNRIVFARQNLIEDPPFARLDLISCRNLLIYFIAPVQKRVLEVFHYSLKTQGYLFLGKSETVDQHSLLFQSVEPRARIYQRRDSSASCSIPQTIGVPGFRRDNHGASPNTAASTDLVSMRTLEALAEQYAPSSLVINADDCIVHFQGDLRPYLQFPQGKAEMYLFGLVDDDLRAELRALVFRCRRDQTTLQGATCRIRYEDMQYAVTPRISPLITGQKSLLLICFLSERLQPDADHHERQSGFTDRDSLIISELEQELANTRSHLNIVVEELETSNEELQSLNEELQSTNEEIQSTNEELQTSNEELQSTNEELLTINEELQVKSNLLEVLANDLTNIMESLTFPLLVVDRTLRITRINSACEQIMQTGQPLIGNALTQSPWLLDVPGLATRVRQVIEEQQGHETSLHGIVDRVYNLRIMPYRTDRNSTEGAVLVFEDVSERRRASEALRASEERFRLFMDNSPTISWIKDEQGRHVYLSRTFERRFNVHLEDWKGRTDAELWPRETAELFRRNDLAVLEANAPVTVIESTTEADGRTTYWLNSKFPFQDASGAWFVGGTGLDITQREVSRQKLEEDRARELAEARTHADDADRARDSLTAILSQDLREPVSRVVEMILTARRHMTSEEGLSRLQSAENALAQILATLVNPPSATEPDRHQAGPDEE